MAEKPPGQSLLENAYQLSTPSDNKSYYRDFAPTYDTDFAQQLGWHYPQAIADAYHRAATPPDLPIADIGCGTGYVAAKLGLPADQIDGIDISPEMLAIARTKSLYRALHELDLTGPLDALSGQYGAVLSAGTFTHGHLGPGPLANLLHIARPGALFIIGVNQEHFTQRQFAETLDALQNAGKISPYRTDVTRMYSNPGHAHSEDRALILHYRKL